MDQNVIHKAAVLIQQAGIVSLSDLQLGSVVGGDVIHQFARLWSANFDLAHVADIEQPDCGSNRFMFLNNAGVLHRHIPPAEINHAGFKRGMSVEERCLLEFGDGGHLGRNLSVTCRRASTPLLR